MTRTLATGKRCRTPRRPNSCRRAHWGVARPGRPSGGDRRVDGGWTRCRPVEVVIMRPGAFREADRFYGFTFCVQPFRATARSSVAGIVDRSGLSLAWSINRPHGDAMFGRASDSKRSCPRPASSVPAIPRSGTGSAVLWVAHSRTTPRPVPDLQIAVRSRCWHTLLGKPE